MSLGRRDKGHQQVRNSRTEAKCKNGSSYEAQKYARTPARIEESHMKRKHRPEGPSGYNNSELRTAQKQEDNTPGLFMMKTEPLGTLSIENRFNDPTNKDSNSTEASKSRTRTGTFEEQRPHSCDGNGGGVAAAARFQGVHGP